MAESCAGRSGEFCLFGYKFGEEREFSDTGVNATRLRTSGGVVSFSFQEEGLVNTHRQGNISSIGFSSLPDCAKSKIREALNEWSRNASIEFQEMTDNSDSDIKIFVARISVGGVGFPNIESSPCNQLAGHVILHPDYTSDCEFLYKYVLHETGHALGLGHAASYNIMGTSLREYQHDGLSSGDIAGIKQIYGKR